MLDNEPDIDKLLMDAQSDEENVQEGNDSTGNLFKIDNYKINDRVLGLDIGTGCIKLLWINNNNIEKGIYRLPHQLPESARFQIIGNEIKRIIAKRNLNSDKVIVTLPEDSLFMVNFKTPSVSKKKLDKSILLTAKKYLPQTLKNITSDYKAFDEKTTSDSKQKNVLFFASEKEILNKYINSIKNSGFKSVKITASAFTILNLLSKCSSSEYTHQTVLIDIGAHKTNIILLKHNRIVFSKIMSFGGNTITEALLHKMNISFNSAEDLKHKVDGDLYDLSKDESKIIDSTLHQFSIEIINIFRSNLSEAETNDIERILLYGGGSNLHGIDKYLSEKLKKNVSVFTPSFNNQRIDPQFLNAFGAAIDLDDELTIFKEKLQTKKTSKSKIKVSVMEAAATLLLFFAFGAYFALTSVNQKYAPELKLLKNNHKQLTSINSVLAEKDRLKKIVKRRYHNTRILNNISRLLPNDVWITKFTSNNIGELRLIGKSYSNELVTGFIANLESSDVLKNVSLLSARKNLVPNRKQVIFFEIRLNIKDEN